MKPRDCTVHSACHPAEAALPGRTARPACPSDSSFPPKRLSSVRGQARCTDLLWLCLLAVLASPLPAQTFATNEFLHVQRGELPIIITAPHGGSLAIPSVPKRLGPEGELKSGKFVTGQDVRTFELATDTAKRVEEITGKKPYLVASKAHRQYVDPNRPEREAVEHPKAAAVHAAFHGQVREFVDELRKKFPQGALLLDIHGQATFPDTLIRGTQNGTTVMRMVEKHGVTALTGEASIFGFMAGKGVKVEPLNTPPGSPPEPPGFNGGYIVRSYGSHTTNGVDAIQLEFGSALRTDAKRREEMSKLLAEAIKAYAVKYLEPEPR